MNDNILEPNDGSGRHIVDVQDLPTNALGAIIQKLNEKSQKSSQIFKEEYSVSVGDIQNLIEKIRQEFHDTNPISETLSLSLHLSNNQRFDFNSWEEFEGFNTSQSERTKSISFEYTRDFVGSDQALERYKVQVACQNMNSRFNLYLGPITLSRIEDAGLPPVPIHSTVSYSNYIRGKNLSGTIEEWVKSLDVEDRSYINFLQKHSGKFPRYGQSLATISALLGCVAFIPGDTASIGELGSFICYAAICIYISYIVGYTLASLAERQIDRHRSKNMIAFTNGDKKFDQMVDGKNKKSMRNASFYAVGIIVQIACSLTASYVFEIVVKGVSG
jgi:hypothetical protein